MGLYDQMNSEAFILKVQEEERLRQEEEARKQQALAELQAKQEEVAALIGIGNQQQQEAEAKAAAQNMGKMVEQFTKEPVVYGPVEPPPPKPAPPPREPVMIPDAQGNLINTEYPGVIAPDGPKAEAALLQDNPLDMGEEPPPEDGPKAELAAEQAAIAEGERVALAAQQQAEAERRALSLAHFTAVGADPQTASVFAEELEAIKKDVFDPLSSAASLDGQARMVRANAQDKRYGEEAAAWEEYTPASKAAINDLLAKTEDRMTKIAAIDAKIAAGEIDPNRVWNNTSDMGKAFIGLGAGMYRLLQLKQGNIGGQNVVLNALDTAIERDINAQKANMDLLIQQRGMQRQSMADEINIYGLQEAALERGRMARINTAIAVMNQEIASGALPLEAQSQYLKDIAELRAKYYDSLHKLGGALSGVVKQQAKRIGKAGSPPGPASDSGLVGSGDPYGVLKTNDPILGGNTLYQHWSKYGVDPQISRKWVIRSNMRRKVARNLNEYINAIEQKDRINLLLSGTRAAGYPERKIKMLNARLNNLNRFLSEAGANFTTMEKELNEAEFQIDVAGMIKGAGDQPEILREVLDALNSDQSADNATVLLPEDYHRKAGNFKYRQLGEYKGDGITTDGRGTVNALTSTFLTAKTVREKADALTNAAAFSNTLRQQPDKVRLDMYNRAVSYMAEIRENHKQEGSEFDESEYAQIRDDYESLLKALKKERLIDKPKAPIKPLERKFKLVY